MLLGNSSWSRQEVVQLLHTNESLILVACFDFPDRFGRMAGSHFSRVR